MREIFVINGFRSAIGNFGGALKDIGPADMASFVVKETLIRSKIDPQWVDELFAGCVLSSGLGQNVARQIAVKTNLQLDIPSSTVNMVCGSGMKCVFEGSRAILSDEANIVIACGVENMSASPYIFPNGRWGARMMNASLIDSMVNDGLWDVFNNYHMGITAENIAEQWKIDRQEMDAFAYESQLKAKKAQEDGRFDQEIISIPVFRKKERISFNKDESLRLSDVEALSKLKPAFKQGGKVTAGNSSGISDGAATIILASREAVEKYHLEPIAKLIGWGFAGVQPDIMGIAPVEAVRRAVNKANTRLEEIDLFELNEAFAVQSLAVIKELSLEKSIVNVNGGAIALGHPIGASGVRIIVTLIHEMLKRKNAKKGLASLCIGGGMGLASIFEKI